MVRLTVRIKLRSICKRTLQILLKKLTMLTKEYRIAMPLTVKEYQIGQVKQ